MDKKNKSEEKPEAVSEAVVIRNLKPTPQTGGILNIVELLVSAGERVCIQGANGSGKTLLLRALTGLSRQYCGQLEVLGIDMLSTKSSMLEKMRADQIGFIFQRCSLVSYLSAYDNILLPCYFSARRRKESILRSGSEEQDAFRLIRQLNLKDPSRLSKNASEYSAGQQKRFAIARALIGRPVLVLADEPASDMDSMGKRAVYQLLLKECMESGATLICTTHDDNYIEGFDRFVDMDAITRSKGRGL